MKPEPNQIDAQTMQPPRQMLKIPAGIFKETLQIPVQQNLINDSKWSHDTAKNVINQASMRSDDNQPTVMLTGRNDNMKPTVEIGLPRPNLQNFGVNFPQSFVQPQTIPANFFAPQPQHQQEQQQYQMTI